MALQLVKKHKWILLALIGFIIIVGWLTRRGNVDAQGTIEARVPLVSLIDLNQRKNGEQEIQASGEVEAREQVDIQSEVSGRIYSMPVSLGQQVYRGQTIAAFTAGDLVAQRDQAQATVEAAQARLTQYEANVDAEETRLRDLQNGARPEDLQIAQTSYNSAELNREEALTNKNIVQEKTESDLERTYRTALRTVAQSINVGLNALYALTDVQYEYYIDKGQEDFEISSTKASAVYALLGADNAGRWVNEFLSPLKEGARGDVIAAEADPSEANIDNALGQSLDALEKILVALNAVPLRSEMTDADITAINTQKQTIQAEIIRVVGLKDSIVNQRRLNETALQQAEEKIVTAQNAVQAAQDQLTLVEAGATAEQIALQESALSQAQSNLDIQKAQIKQYEAQVAAIQARLAKTALVAPINGKIAALPLRVGELVSPGSLVASIVNTNGLQVNAFIDSSELAQIRLNADVFIDDIAAGSVSFIAPSLDPQTRKVEVIVSIEEDASANFVVGQFVDMRISVDPALQEENPVQAILPLTSIVIEESGTSVFTVSDDMIIAVSVVLGRVFGQSVEILSGLESLDEIVEGVRGLQAGDRVRLQ